MGRTERGGNLGLEKVAAGSSGYSPNKRPSLRPSGKDTSASEGVRNCYGGGITSGMNANIFITWEVPGRWRHDCEVIGLQTRSGMEEQAAGDFGMN